MRVGIVYTGVPNYMVDCWRALSRQESVSLKIWTEDSGRYNVLGDSERRLEGLDAEVMQSKDITCDALKRVVAEIKEFAPDVLFVSGWSLRLPRYVAKSGVLRSIPKVLDFDMPWEWQFRKIAARFVLASYTRRFCAAFVPGRATRPYARWLGFGSDKVYGGRNCIDVNSYAGNGLGRKRIGFVFVGRFSGEKGIDVLVKAYSRYRTLVNDSDDVWPLDMYGGGNLEPLFSDVEGVTVHGVTSPESLKEVYARAGLLILPSLWEAWGVVLLEAAASGCPIICTDKCGGRLDIVENGVNGLVVPAGNSDALASAMYDVATGAKKFDGERGREIANDYSCERWVRRVMQIVENERL